RRLAATRRADQRRYTPGGYIDGDVKQRLLGAIKYIQTRSGNFRHKTYQRTSNRLRKIIASIVRRSKNTSTTRMPAAVFSANHVSGLPAHRYICTGMAVAGDVNPDGTSAIKATMPIIRSGAVSPIARASPKIVPVMMPGMDSGSTWCHTTCNGDAPSA